MTVRDQPQAFDGADVERRDKLRMVWLARRTFLGT
jgi:hypothetical protein